MGVYIKGIKMPENCDRCPCSNDLGCAVKNIVMPSKQMSEKRPEWCPLVEVPEPHGKLVEFIDVATYEDDDSGTEEVNLGEAFAAYFKMREAKPVIEVEGE